MSRSLGEGDIVKVLKNYAFIRDEKLGQVYFPICAANVRQNCYDLRERFNEGDHVIYTALKQQDIKNDCQYVTSSVVRRYELIEEIGKISERHDKFCYVDLPHGRVFVPYSARNCNGKPWLGRGSEVGVAVVIKFFPQPDIKDCSFVAFNCSVLEANGPPGIMSSISSTQGGSHRAPSMVLEQIGCIVLWKGVNGDSEVYSSVTGLALLPSVYTEPYMGLGTWIKYNVKKNPEGSRVAWTASSPVDLGTLFEPIPYPLDPSRLQLQFDAVVNRVDKKSRAAWMWNDFIGRIYVPPLYFRGSLRPFECVRITAVYTGHFEDVPWSAIVIKELGDEESIRNECSLMLHTCDKWKVSHVQHAQGTFYSFLENDKFGSAFAAWTDYTSGDQPPVPLTKCRVTVYRQERDKKHVYRAVMVTPLDEAGHPIYHHPLYSPGDTLPNGLSPPLPKPWMKPSPPIPRPLTPPGFSSKSIDRSSYDMKIKGGNVSPLTVTQVIGDGRRSHLNSSSSSFHYQSESFYPISSSSSSDHNLHISSHNGFHSNGFDLSPVLGNGHYSSGRQSPVTCGPSQAEIIDALGFGDEGKDEENAIISPLTPDSTSIHNSSGMFNEFIQETWWRPDAPSDTSDHLAPGFRPPSKMTSVGTTSSTPSVTMIDCGTQTDTMAEHKVIRDIIANSALLVKIFEVLPQQVEAIMNISSFIKRTVD